MPKLFIRLAVVLLIPALVLDPGTAQAFSPSGLLSPTHSTTFSLFRINTEALSESALWQEHVFGETATPSGIPNMGPAFEVRKTAEQTSAGAVGAVPAQTSPAGFGASLQFIWDKAESAYKNTGWFIKAVVVISVVVLYTYIQSFFPVNRINPVNIAFVKVGYSGELASSRIKDHIEAIYNQIRNAEGGRYATHAAEEIDFEVPGTTFHVKDIQHFLQTRFNWGSPEVTIYLTPDPNAKNPSKEFRIYIDVTQNGGHSVSAVVNEARGDDLEAVAEDVAREVVRIFDPVSRATFAYFVDGDLSFANQLVIQRSNVVQNPKLVKSAPVTEVLEGFLHLGLGQLHPGEPSSLAESQKAVDIFTAQLKKHPNDPVLLNSRGEAYMQLNREDEAKRDFEASKQADPKYVAPYINLGRLLMAHENYKEALPLMQQAAAMEPINSSVYRLLAEILSESAGSPELIPMIEKAYQKGPQSERPAVRRYWGRILLGRKDKAGAIEQYREALKLDPTYFPALEDLAEIYASEGKIDQAIQMMDTALLQKPNDPLIMLEKGKLLFRKKDFRAGYDAVFGAGIFSDFLDPKVSKVLFLMQVGGILMDEAENHAKTADPLEHPDKFAQAIAQYDKALALDPTNIFILEKMAIAYERIGGHRESRAMLERMMNASTDSITYRIVNILVHEPIGSAREFFENLIRTAPQQYPYIHRAYAEYLRKINKPDEAIQQYRADLALVTTTDEEKIMDFNAIVVTLHDAHRDKDILKVYREAIRAFPKQYLLYRNLEGFLIERGDYPQAIQVLDEALALLRKNPDPEESSLEYERQRIQRLWDKKRAASSPTSRVPQERHLPVGVGGHLREARHNDGIHADVRHGWQTVPGHARGGASLGRSAPKRADAVFEGGGVKGIGLVGAATVVEEHGYQWENLAGTSAGSIVAALLAAGYTAKELADIVNTLDYEKFKDCNLIGYIPVAGPLFNLLTRKGIYKGEYFLSWITEHLKAKGLTHFGDLTIRGEKDPRYRYKLSVIASDVSNGRMVQFPQGAEWYGLNPDTISIAQAIRMSMSIPYFFMPVRFRTNYMVDGGILSNFPVWIFDQAGPPDWPTFGFKFIQPEAGHPAEIHSPVSLGFSILSTMMEAHDKMHVEADDWLRTIGIPTMGVRSTEFDLSGAERNALFKSGINAARKFFTTWDWRAHLERRLQPDPKYLTKVHQLRSHIVGQVAPHPLGRAA